MPSSPSDAVIVAAESARYALLRRLAPSIRHHLVVHLQPMSMIYELMQRRVTAPQPKLEEIQDTADRMNRLAKAAMASSLDVITWLSPDEAASTKLEDTVAECLALVGSSLGFRGFALRNEVGAVEGEVRKAAVRALVCGSLIHLCDVHDPPAEILMTASPATGATLLRFEVQPGEGNAGFSTAPAYRPLTWDDLRAIAAAEAVGIDPIEDGLELRFPRVGIMPRP